MSWTDRSIRLLPTLALLGVGAGCADEIPTLTGREHFPEGALPATVELVVPAAEFITNIDVFTGFADPGNVTYRVVARAFEGVLDANTLARFTLPGTLTYSAGGTSTTDTLPIFRSGRVWSVVNDSASAGTGPVVLRLWSLAQPWDSATVSWTHAVDRAGNRIPWAMAGGSRREALAEVTWTPGTDVVDTLSWTLDAATLERMRAPDFPGLLLTSETQGSRVELGPLNLELSLSPSARPDTTIVQSAVPGPQTFVYSPEQPQRAGTLQVGGVRGDRSILRVDLSRGVPGCPEPVPAGCPSVPLREVSLNRATLLLEPVAVPQGFRPLQPVWIFARRVVEPHLGRRATLAEMVAVDTIPAGRFAAEGGPAVALDLTLAMRQLAASDTLTTAIALLSEPEGGRFGPAWFAGSPRLRLLYTLPQRARLP